MKKLHGSESSDELLSLARNQQAAFLSAFALSQFIKALIEERIGPGELQIIAEALECDNICYEASKSELIAQALFEITSPEINGSIDNNRYAELIENLKPCEADSSGLNSCE